MEKARAACSGEGVINTAFIERLNATFRVPAVSVLDLKIAVMPALADPESAL